MRTRTGLILAWDKSDLQESDLELLHSLGPYLDRIKVGLEAMNTFVTIGDERIQLAAAIANYAYDECHTLVMWDGKLKDISNTVLNAAKNIFSENKGINMLTVHADNSDACLSGVAELCQKHEALPLAVTVLTDIDEAQCRIRYGDIPRKVVGHLAANAWERGIRGLVCSGQELSVPEVQRMTTVVPGIRPSWAQSDDQKRVMTPAEAARAGAHYIVVGRPILKPPSGMTPVEAAKRIREELDAALPPGSIVDKRV